MDSPGSIIFITTSCWRHSRSFMLSNVESDWGRLALEVELHMFGISRPLTSIKNWWLGCSSFSSASKLYKCNYIIVGSHILQIVRMCILVHTKDSVPNNAKLTLMLVRSVWETILFSLSRIWLTAFDSTLCSISLGSANWPFSSDLDIVGLSRYGNILHIHEQESGRKGSSGSKKCPVRVIPTIMQH